MDGVRTVQGVRDDKFGGGARRWRRMRVGVVISALQTESLDEIVPTASGNLQYDIAYYYTKGR